MDVTYYVGIGIAIGAAMGGAAAAIVKVRKEKYTQAKDEFKTLLTEIKEDKEQKEVRITALERAVDQCKEDHHNEKMKTFRLEQEIELLKRALNIGKK